MKTNFFKIVLPAFALMLAITASLAFTSAENNAEDSVSNPWFIDANTTSSTLGQCVLYPVTINDCQVEETATLCKIAIPEQPSLRQMYEKNVFGTCSILLYKVTP